MSWFQLSLSLSLSLIAPSFPQLTQSQRSCYQTSLDLAVKNGLSAIAFAAISTGIYGYPSYHAARVALDTVRRFMETDDGAKLDLVVFCNFEEEDETAYSELAS